MRIDIWSDIMCPFCYIGKRKLEQALDNFEHKKDVEIVWHSFQLDPDMQPAAGTDIYGYLAERKGQSREWSVNMHKNMEQMAAKDGLEYNFNKAIPANSFNAHRLIQLAKTHGLGDAAEERLFKAYFTEGKNINNTDTLQQIGMDLGLSAVTVGEMLGSDAFADEVQADVHHAAELGINGVPFFVLNNRYGISGAQPVSLFSDALQQAWAEYETAQSITTLAGNGPACTDDSCEIPSKN